MSRYDDIDSIAVPDQWSDIVARAEAGDLLDLEPDTPRRRLGRVVPAIAVAAAVLAAAVTVGVVLDDEQSDVATMAVPIRDGMPDLVCPGGELVDGSLPPEATANEHPLYTIPLVRSIQPGTMVWAWEVRGLQVQVNVPPVPWADQGRPTAEIDAPPGTALYQPASTSFIGDTGLDAKDGCGAYEVMVGGGTDDEEVALAVEVAGSLRWESVEVMGTSGVRSTTESIRQWALTDAQSQLHDESATGVAYVLEWRVGEEVPPGLSTRDDGGPGARRWAVVFVAESATAFQGQRGNPYGEAPPPVQVLISEFGDGQVRGHSMRPLDSFVEQIVAGRTGVPFVVG